MKATCLGEGHPENKPIFIKIMMSLIKEHNLTGPRVSDPQDPAGYRSSPDLYPSSSYDGLTLELLAGSGAEHTTAELIEVEPDEACGSREAPRVLSVEHGVFIWPRKRRKPVSLSESADSGEEPRGGDPHNGCQYQSVDPDEWNRDGV